jgi:Creatinase/Prolidase N-terminal domain
MITAEERRLANRHRTSRVRVSNVSEIDFGRLRAGRLARLQAMMKRYDLPVCLLFNPSRIRYATGTDVMGVWTAGTFARYCVVPAEGEPVLFEYRGSISRVPEAGPGRPPGVRLAVRQRAVARQGPAVGGVDPLPPARASPRGGAAGRRQAGHRGGPRSRPRGSRSRGSGPAPSTPAR